MCVSQITWWSNRYMCVSISGQIPGASALIQEAPAVKLTLNDRWKPVTSVILFWTILPRLGGDLWLRRRQWLLGIPNCTSPKDQSPSRESQVVTLRWWARCGVLNGSPGDATKHTSYIHNLLKRCRRPEVSKIYVHLLAKRSTRTPRLMFVTC